jgi:rhodanese-related sulfurtransferase
LKKTTITLIIFAFIVSSFLLAQNTSNAFKMVAKVFAEKIKTLPNAPLLDIRTPAEFNDGHIEKAINCDWYATTFESQVLLLDKSKPVFIYCHSGGRSAAAVAKMNTLGFKEIYELAGGISSWKMAGLAVTKK